MIVEMFRRRAGLWCALWLAALSLNASQAASASPLRVCADPNNLPFSNAAGEGFENVLAQMLAQDAGRPLEYTWWPQRRGFIRNTLKAGLCDVVIGAPARFDLAKTTRAYYRSTYVFVTRAADHAPIESFDDPRLKELLVGVHLIGDDGANAPPAHALAERGIVNNVRGYTLYGDYARPDPPRDVLDALVRKQIDVAIVWGPLAGYFAQRAPVKLSITPVSPQRAGGAPMTFEIAMAVRRGDDETHRLLEDFLNRRAADVRATLTRYGVPLLDE